MRKTLKLILTVATVVARNANEVIVALMVGFDEVTFLGSLESGSWFCVDAFGRNLACRREDGFTFNTLLKQIL
jgi:hypothetical protein